MKNNQLKEYNRKRNFKVTKEPSGEAKSAGKRKSTKLSFVVQEHHASHLHYDFRLEWEGVLKSWAVPKGPSQDPKDKRLAVQTEDHPLEYGKFQGTIPKGEYGAGEVFIWDKGTWEPEGDPEYGFEKGHLQFTLKGKKLKGKWHLVKTRWGTEKARANNWLLIKSADDNIAAKKSTSKKVSKKKAKLKADDTWPGFIPPQLPRLVTEVPVDAEWLHEIKYDGYRMQGHVKNNLARLLTRNGLEWSNYFPHILESMGKLEISSAIFDGEIVILDEAGHSHFQKLQNSLKSKNDSALRYYVFDILYLNGEDLRDLPLLERKSILKKVLKNSPDNILFSEHITQQGEDFYKLTCEHKLEGIVSKLADGPYRSGRNDLWVKTKCTLRQEFVIGGYTEAQGGRTGFGALLLGVYENGSLKYAGRVGTGFNRQSLTAIKKILQPLKRKTTPFELNSPSAKGIHWLKPVKVAEVSFSQWTDEGILRTPVFLGLREDKPAKDIVMEKARNNPGKTTKSSSLREITSPEKILFKKEQITKKEVADYYAAIASHMLPYIKDRPLSLVRCPEGSLGTCFYQKHIKGKIPDSLHTFALQEEGGKGIYLSVDSARGLRELVQINAFELHAWNCQRHAIMRPDQIVMDFDPGPGVPWKEVVCAAFELKDLLDELNLKSFVKLTGGKGIHVHIPVASLYDWDQIKTFSQTLALQLVSMNPGKYTSNMSKHLRKGKIFVDYLRNGYGATAVVPYSLRARELSTVAIPLEWHELKKIKGPQQYTLRKALKKIKTRKVDPWKGMMRLQQRIEILKPHKKLAA